MASRARGERSPVDDEFLHNLYKGGELLAAGKVIEAKDYLERAFQLQPKNEKGQNLLGLTYFKLGLFDRAAEIYEALVRDNPVDATLRVNLGLVYLKTNQLQRAIREFENAVDLAPEHKKAHNYLGLALAQIGHYAEARHHFLEAGSEAMAQKMERAMAGEAMVLQRMPAPLEQQKQQRFAEIEGSEIVAERGGQQVADEHAKAAKANARIAPALDVPVKGASASASESSPSPAETPVYEQDWGAHFGEASSQTEAPPRVEAARTRPPQDEEIRFAEDEGPPAIGAHAEEVEIEVTASEGVMTPEELGATISSGVGGEEGANEGLAAAAAAAAAAGQPAPAEAAAEAMPVSVEEPARLAAAEWWEARPLSELKPETASGVPISELAPALELLRGAVRAPFEVRPGGAAITIDGEVLTRAEGLLLTAGAVKYEPELKRFRGRTTEQTFGEGVARMLRASGRGVMVVAAPENHRFVAIDLADESAYFREEVVYAFEEAVMFENGRVPSETTGDLDLVHLRGKGKVLLRLEGELRAHQVRMDEPATVPLERLVGWFGNVTPKLVPLVLEETGKPVKGGAELSGEGYVLLSVPK